MTSEPRDNMSDDEDLEVFLDSEAFLDEDDSKPDESAALDAGGLEEADLDFADLPSDSAPVSGRERPARPIGPAESEKVEAADDEGDVAGSGSPDRPVGPAESMKVDSTADEQDVPDLGVTAEPISKGATAGEYDEEEPRTTQRPAPKKPPAAATSSVPRYALAVAFLVIIGGLAFNLWWTWKLGQRSEGTVPVSTTAPSGQAAADTGGATPRPTSGSQPATSGDVSQPSAGGSGTTIAQLLQPPISSEKIDGILGQLRKTQPTQQERQQVYDWLFTAFAEAPEGSELRQLLMDVYDALTTLSNGTTGRASSGASRADEFPFFVALMQPAEAHARPPGLQASFQADAREKLFDQSVWDESARVAEDLKAKPDVRHKALVRMIGLAKKYGGGEQVSQLQQEAEAIGKAEPGPASPGAGATQETLTRLQNIQNEQQRMRTDFGDVQTQLQAMAKETGELRQQADAQAKALLDVQGEVTGPGQPMADSSAPLNMSSIRQFLDAAKQRVAALKSEAKTPLMERINAVEGEFQPQLPTAKAAELVAACQGIAFDLQKLEMDELPAAQPMQAPTGDAAAADKTRIVGFLNRLDLQLLKPSAADGPQRASWDQLDMKVQQLLARLNAAESLSLADVSDINVELAEIANIAGRLYADKIVAALPRAPSDATGGQPGQGTTSTDVPGRSDSGVATTPVAGRAPDAALPAERGVEFDERLVKLENIVQDQVTGVAQRVLEKLAGYGYVPPSEQAANPAAGTPEVVEAEKPAPDPKLASQAFAYGVPAFFSHDPVAQAQAFEQFRAAVKYDPDDPVYRYFLALTLFGQGRLPEASAQAYAAVKRESGQYDRQRVARSLERVQGPTRAWLEEIRVNALLRP